MANGNGTTKEPNGKRNLIYAIPLSLLLGAVFGGGGMCYAVRDVVQEVSDIKEQKRAEQVHETRQDVDIAKLSVLYEETANNIKEIKDTLNDIRKERSQK